MFSQVEIDYVLSLINTYQRLGYKNYLCHTITENDDVYDISIYFSKKEIKVVTNNTFDLTEAIHIEIDSSNRNDSGYNPSTHSRDYVVSSNLTSIVEVNQAEFIYTNATPNTSSITAVNPDLLLNASQNYNNSILIGAGVVLCGMIFLYMFFKSILRVKR